MPEELYKHALSDPGSDRMSRILRLAETYGLKCAETSVVNVDDLSEDLFGPTLRVHGTGQKLRDIPLTPEFAREIRREADR